MRCFIAVECPQEVKEKFAGIQKVIREFGEMSIVKPENMHLTLKFLGEVDDKQAGKVSNALESVQYMRYDATIRGLGVFPKPDYVRVVWAGVEDEGRTKELASIVDSIMKPLGFPAEKDFQPHLTLARVKFLKDKSKLAEVIERRSNEVFGSYTVDKLLLMKSVLSPKGPEYSVVKEIKLA